MGDMPVYAKAGDGSIINGSPRLELGKKQRKLRVVTFVDLELYLHTPPSYPLLLTAACTKRLEAH